VVPATLTNGRQPGPPPMPAYAQQREYSQQQAQAFQEDADPREQRREKRAKRKKSRRDSGKISPHDRPSE
jgi:hypothetical protein